MLELAVFGFFCMGAVALDFRAERVPNLWNFLFFFAGLAIAKTPLYVVTGVLALASGYWLWRVGAWGAGDGKFFAVLTSWGVVFGFAEWFGAYLFLATAAWLAPAWWLKSGVEKYVRWPGAPFMVLGFMSLLAVRCVASPI